MRTILLISLLSMLTITDMISCGCINEGNLKRKSLKKFQLIVEGTVIKVENESFDTQFFIRTEKVYKSQSKIINSIKIGTPKGSCEFSAMVGEKWLFFAYSRSDGSYTTDVCMRNQLLDPTSKDYYKDQHVSDRKLLKKIKNY